MTNVNNKLGSIQSITVDTVPSGTVAGDFIMVAGVAATTPVFLYGIPYFHNTSTTGTYLGIARTQNYVVANGVAAGGAPLSLPMLRAALSRVEQSLGTERPQDPGVACTSVTDPGLRGDGLCQARILMNDGKMPRLRRAYGRCPELQNCGQGGRTEYSRRQYENRLHGIWLVAEGRLG